MILNLYRKIADTLRSLSDADSELSDSEECFKHGKSYCLVIVFVKLTHLLSPMPWVV